jgi:hypothetical protein
MSISAAAMVGAGEAGSASSDPEFADTSRILREDPRGAGPKVSALLTLCVDGGHLF